MPTSRTDLDHFLQLRLTKATVAEIDEAIATVVPLDGFNRCRFIRCALRYALDSIAAECDSPTTKEEFFQ